MEEKKSSQSLMKGAMILSIGIFVSRIIGLLYRIPITNIIGDEGNALYNVAYSIYANILALTAIAMPGALSKLVAEREAIGAYRDAHRVYQITLRYFTLLAGLLAFLMAVGAPWIARTFFPEQDVVMPIQALAPTVVIATVIAIMRGYFQGRNHMTPTAISQVIEQIFNVIFSVALAYMMVGISLTAGATGSTLGTGIGALAGFIVLLFIYYKQRPALKQQIGRSQNTTYESTWIILKKLMVIMVPMVITTSVFSVMTTIDQSMITKFLPQSIDSLKARGMADYIPIAQASNLETNEIVAKLLGQFGFQYTTFINIPISLVLQLAAAAVPAIAAAMSVGNYKEVRHKTKLIFKIGLLVATPCSIAFLLFGEPIIALILSNPTGGKLLAAGGIGLIFITLAQLSAGILQGMGRPQVATFNALIACFIKVVLNSIALSIPILNIYGFIHSTALCYFIYALLNIRYLSKLLHLRFNWRKLLLKPLGSSIVMGIISMLVYVLVEKILDGSKWSMLFVIPVAMLTYFIVGLKTGTITKQDLLYLPGGKKLIHFLNKE
ncbi:polysaccharide biosynthesis protein [Sporanaerobium hydrogeniformans]|uniref:Polysaccharide biosynthesis protein n=1 Tax=Sporanaerobium hydrogeniformans TaxID=3072179 RepID=A0AC61DF53_9FIRM|nr:polysaccharide biosynthesis protein [Sporanaerobium hydrogeniformans]PHV71673.1 polysaccharide biosynthesis protein [Sporanaerobium hydrogeniformans]